MSLFGNLTVRSVALAVGVLACDDDDTPADPTTSFTATLSGTNEVPPVRCLSLYFDTAFPLREGSFRLWAFGDGLGFRR